MGSLTSFPSLLVEHLIADLRISAHCIYREIEDGVGIWELDLAEIACIGQMEVWANFYHVTAYDVEGRGMRMEFEQMEGHPLTLDEPHWLIKRFDWGTVASEWRQLFLDLVCKTMGLESSRWITPLHTWG